MRTSSKPALLRTTPHVAFRLLKRVPGPRPEMTHGLLSCRGRETSTCLAVGDSGTARAPVFASRNRISSCSRSTSSHRSVRISLRRHPVSISRRSPAAAVVAILPVVSSSSSTVPSRRNSRSDRKRSQLRVGYFLMNRQGFPPLRGVARFRGLVEQARQQPDYLVRRGRLLAQPIVQRRDLLGRDFAETLPPKLRQEILVEDVPARSRGRRFTPHLHVFGHVLFRQLGDCRSAGGNRSPRRVEPASRRSSCSQ